MKSEKTKLPSPIFSTTAARKATGEDASRLQEKDHFGISTAAQEAVQAFFRRSEARDPGSNTSQHAQVIKATDAVCRLLRTKHGLTAFRHLIKQFVTVKHEFVPTRDVGSS